MLQYQCTRKGVDDNFLQSIKTYFMGTYQKALGESLLMSTHSKWFFEK